MRTHVLSVEYLMTQSARQAYPYVHVPLPLAKTWRRFARKHVHDSAHARALESRILLIYCARAPRSQDTRTNMCRVCTLVLNRSVSCLCGNTYTLLSMRYKQTFKCTPCIAGALKCRHKHKRAEHTPLMCRRRGFAQSSYWLCCCCCWAPVVAIAYTPLL